MATDLFKKIKELGRGGMGVIYEVEANPNSTDFPQFLADMIAWREATKEETFSDLVSSIQATRQDMDQLVKTEMTLQDSSFDLTKQVERQLRQVKGQLKRQKKSLRSSILQLRGVQLEYVRGRTHELVIKYNLEQLKPLLEEYGIILPSDLRFAFKQALRSPKTTDEDWNEILRRLQDEKNALINWRHPNIVEILSGGTSYYVMELIRGKRDVKDIIANDTVRQKIKILLKTAKGLDYAHQHGVIHRDLKPDNIAVDKDEDVKVIDFGLAKTDYGLTISGQIMGTPHYMPPEQIRDSKSCDETSDIYSLGATAYHLIAERPPFYTGKEIQPYELIIRIMEEPVPPLREIVPAVPTELEEIIMRMMEKDQSQRPQSMAEVEDNFQHYLDVETPATLNSISLHNISAVSLPSARSRIRVRRRRRISEYIEKANGRAKRTAERARTPAPKQNPIYKIGAAVAGGVAALGLIGALLFGGKKETPRLPPPVIEPPKVEVPVVKTPDYRAQYADFLPRVTSLEKELSDFLARGRTDLQRLNELNNRLKELYPQVVEFKGKGVEEAGKLSQRLLPYMGKLAARNSLINEFDQFKKENQTLESEIDKYMQAGEFKAEELAVFSQRLIQAKTKAGEYREKRFPVNDLTRKLEGWEGKVTAQQEILRKKAEEAKEPKQPETYLTFAGESINLGKEISDFIESKSLEADKLTELKRKLEESKKQAQQYKDVGIQGADKLLEQLVGYDGQLTPVQRFISRKSSTIEYVHGLEAQIEEAGNDKRKLNSLLRTVKSHIYPTAQLVRTEGQVAQPLLDKLKEYQKTIDDKIAGVVSGPKIPEGCVYYAGKVVEQGGKTYVQDLSGKNNHGVVNGAQLVKDGDIEALQFDGKDDYLEINTKSMDKNQGTIVVMAKAIGQGTGENNEFIFFHQTPGKDNRIYFLRRKTDNNELYVGMGADLIDTNYKLNQDTWYHITLAWSGANYDVYVNGNNIKSGSSSVITSIDNTARISYPGQAFNGLIRGLRIFNRVLNKR